MLLCDAACSAELCSAELYCSLLCCAVLRCAALWWSVVFVCCTVCTLLTHIIPACDQVVDALNTLDGELRGRYFPLSNMSEEDRQALVAAHFLFKKGDRFLEAAGANRDWPESRGIFHNDSKTFLVWVNEEDQMRIISMQPGQDVAEVFARLCTAVGAIEDVRARRSAWCG